MVHSLTLSIILPFWFFSPLSYMSRKCTFHASLSLCLNTSFLPRSFSHYFLYFVFFCPHVTFRFFFLSSPNFFSCCLFITAASLHPVLVLNKYITQHLVFLLTPLLLPFVLLSEKQRGVIMFVSHIPIIPPQRHHWTIMPYCK